MIYRKNYHGRYNVTKAFLTHGFHHMSLSRRGFLLKSLAAVSGLAHACRTEAANSLLTDSFQSTSPRLGKKARSLVIIQLNGGNDAFNTIVPHRRSEYFELRPRLSLKEDALIPVDSDFAMNSALVELHGLLEMGKLAVVNGVGYPNLNRSHFRASEIWHTAQPQEIGESGWLKRYLELPSVIESLKKRKLVRGALCTNTFLSGAFFGSDSDKVASLKTVSTHFGSRNYSTQRGFPPTRFGNALRSISESLKSDQPYHIYSASLDGFDTHAEQKELHNSLLSELSSGIWAFYNDLINADLADLVCILLYSEFGRQLVENPGRGTDHGGMGTAFIIGGEVKGGLYGASPEMLINNSLELLRDVDPVQNNFAVDFRSIYAEILDYWLGTSSETVLGGKFTPVGFLASDQTSSLKKL